jgi:hypothetical protein
MAVKSALHRLARRLPSSSEVYNMVESLERDIDARFDDARDVTPAKSSSLLASIASDEPAKHDEPDAELPDLDDVFGSADE